MSSSGITALRVAVVASMATRPMVAQQSAPPASPPIAVKLGGYVQARETYRSDTKLTATLNRVRVIAEGTLPGGFSFRVMPEYEAGGSSTAAASVSLRDAYVRWTKGAFNLTAGQYKTPFSPEYITSITAIETADRATVVDSLATKRDIGLMTQYAAGPWGTLSLGVFNGLGQNRISNNDSTALVVGRVAVRPIPFVTVGGNVARYNADSTRWGVDAEAEYRGASLRGEFIWQHRKLDAPADRGWYGVAAYRVLPWVQVVLKQELFERPAISAKQRNVATTGGVNLYFSASRIRLLANYVSRKLGTPGVRRGSVITQLQVRF